MAFLGVFRALYDYAPQSHEELAIKDGDLLLKLPDDDDDGQWIRAKLKAKSDDEEEPEGLIPANYVEEAAVLYRAKALYDYERQTEEELSFEEGKVVEVYDITDEDWTLVGDRATGTYGFAPAIYIEKVAVESNGVAPTRELAPPPMPTRPQIPTEPISQPASSGYGPIPGEADYVPPQQSPTSPSNPASALASIIAQRTGGSAPIAGSQGELASPPLPTRPQQSYDEPYYEEEPEPPPKPARPQSQAIPPPIAPPLPIQPPTSYSPREPQLSPGIMTSSPHNREVARSQAVSAYDDDAQLHSPGGFHLYNVHEMVSHMGKNRKMGCTLGINLAVGIITLSPEKSRDGPTQEWTADKLTHYSIEGKHVFLNLVRPSKDLDLHAGAKDTAKEIVSMLGELAGAVRAGSQGLSEIMGASRGRQRMGKMLYEFMAQGEDEVTVAVGDEVIIVDSEKSDEWWQIKRVKNGKEGVVPSSYVELTGTIGATGSATVPGYTTAKDRVEENRKEEERLAKQAAKSSVPDRSTSLHARTSSRQNGSRGERNNTSESSKTKSKPRQDKLRTWTDRTGTFKVEAEFVGLRDGKIHLHKVNGVKIAVPVSKMSVEDLEFVENATGQSLDEDKPLSDIKRRSTLKAKEGRSSERAAQKSGASVQKEDGYDWFDFFLQAGCNPQICERYAHAFSRDQMSPEILPEVNEQLLRTLGLKEGDILRVMKFLDAKYDRKRTPAVTPGTAAADDSDKIESADVGGLFSGPGGALKINTTRKGRPAPAVATNDTVSADALRSGTASPDIRSPSNETPVAKAPEKSTMAAAGFDDDAWDVRPSKTAAAQPLPPPEPPKPIEPPKPRINDDIASLSVNAPPLQPTPAAPAPVLQPMLTQTPTAPPNPPPQEPHPPQGANAEIFNKIASLAPARQRPQPPPQTMNNSGLAPPPRAASAPGFNPQQNGFGQPPLHPQLTGVQYPQQTGFGIPSNMMMQQTTGFPGQQPQQFSGGFQPGLSAFSGPQQAANNIQGLQTNYPSLAPQQTGFGAQQYQQQLAQQKLQNQQTGFGMQGSQTQYLGGQSTGFVNGQQTGSPFADPPRQPFQPTPSNLQNSFMPQQTGFGAQQPNFQYSAPTGVQNGAFGQQAPQLPPQQTGGVFGPGAPTGMNPPAAAPLTAQKTGPAPPVRFGVQEQPAARPLTAQKTGADLRRATPQNPFGF